MRRAEKQGIVGAVQVLCLDVGVVQGGPQKEDGATERLGRKGGEFGVPLGVDGERVAEKGGGIAQPAWVNQERVAIRGDVKRDGRLCAFGDGGSDLETVASVEKAKEHCKTAFNKTVTAVCTVGRVAHT